MSPARARRPSAPEHPNVQDSARGAIRARVLAVRPHPDQVTSNPDCWAVQLRVTRGGRSRTFWRWHTARRPNADYAAQGGRPPSSDEVLARFWDDVFGELHGFDFRDD